MAYAVKEVKLEDLIVLAGFKSVKTYVVSEDPPFSKVFGSNAGNQLLLAGCGALSACL